MSIYFNCNLPSICFDDFDENERFNFFLEEKYKILLKRLDDESSILVIPPSFLLLFPYLDIIKRNLKIYIKENYSRN